MTGRLARWLMPDAEPGWIGDRHVVEREPGGGSEL